MITIIKGSLRDYFKRSENFGIYAMRNVAGVANRKNFFRGPDLLRAIKISVDDGRRSGRFLLTGSANGLTLPQVSESLAGRMEIVTLLPLSRAEVLGRKPTFLQKAFLGEISKATEIMIGQDLVHSVLIGGYPEMLRRKDPKRRRAWARDYVNAIVQRDVRDIAHGKARADAKTFQCSGSSLRPPHQLHPDRGPDRAG